MTRADAQAIFQTVIEDILDQQDNSPIALALSQANVMNFADFFCITKRQIEQLRYYPKSTEDDPNLLEKNLTIRHQNLLIWLQKWVKHLQDDVNEGQQLDETQWADITKADFDNYRISAPLDGTMIAPTVPPPPSPTSTSINKEVANFKKSIKQDASSYPIFKDQKYWNNWNCSFISQACMHDCMDVCDPHYKPKDAAAVAIFKEKQSFIYVVLNKVVQTDQGKTFVHQHEVDFDVQKVYAKLLNHAKNSTTAELSKDDLQTKLVTLQLDSRWHGTSEGFILHWVEQMHLYDDLVPVAEQYADPTKHRMLEQAVSAIPELYTIKDIDLNHIAIGGQALTYEQYKDLLLAAAVKRDRKMKTLTQHSKTTVNETLWNPVEQEEDWFECGYVDAGFEYIEEPEPTSTMIHQMQTSSNNVKHPYIPPDVWRQLP